MRRFINNIKQEKIYCGLDIGASKIKVAAIKVSESSDSELIGVYESKTYGFKDSAVSDLGEFSECIHKSLTSLMKKAGIKIKELTVGVSGRLIEGRYSSTIIPLVDRGSKVIVQKDIVKVSEQARLLGVKMDEEILHNIAQYYKVDDEQKAKNPKGLHARKLGVHILLMIMKANLLRNISKVTVQSGFDVQNIVFDSYAGSLVCLSELEKREGCLLIDIGSSVTSLLSYKDGLLNVFEVIPIGSSNFTESISQKLNLPFDLSEDIKTSYGEVHKSDHYDEDVLVNRNGHYVQLKKDDIYDALEIIVSQWVEGVIGIINSNELVMHLNRGIVVIGGGALLSGMIELIEQATKKPVRIGKTLSAAKMRKHHSAVFMSAIGVAHYGIEQNLQKMQGVRDNTAWSKHLFSKAKELYWEYF